MSIVLVIVSYFVEVAVLFAVATCIDQYVKDHKLRYLVSTMFGISALLTIMMIKYR